jgi:PKHD-type hydroxylase
MQVTQTIKLFTPEECDTIIDMAMTSRKLERARQTGFQGQLSRDCILCWLPITPKIQWLYNRLLPFFHKAGCSRMEEPQFCFYLPSMYFDWHFDNLAGYGHGTDRIAGAVIQLSDPEDYEGGELQVQDENENTITVDKRRGTMVFMSGEVLHRVTKLESGSRYSITIWGLR